MPEYVETYCGCDIFLHLSGVYTSPCTEYARFTVDRVKQDIRAGGYCDEAPPPPEGEASITSIDLPTKLQAGEWIVGTLKVKNVGAGKDMIRILVTADWIPKTWESVYVLEVGQTLSASLVSGMVEMPSQDARFTLKGQHEENGVWVTDDTKTH